jgi:hypothetical protein
MLSANVTTTVTVSPFVRASATQISRHSGKSLIIAPLIPRGLIFDQPFQVLNPAMLVIVGKAEVEFGWIEPSGRAATCYLGVLDRNQALIWPVNQRSPLLASYSELTV